MGTFTAWLSDTLDDARSRVTHSPHPYVRTDGIIVANDWADLIDGTLDAPIDVDENGLPGGGSDVVWSATDIDGTQAPGTNSSSTCNDWTSNAETGLYGWRSATNTDWTDCSGPGGSCGGPADCDPIAQHLYCFED